MAAKFASVEDLSQLLELKKVIKLEMTEASMIARIGDVEKVENHWFVLDSTQGKILAFDEEGQFRGFIGRLGEGPGEFTRPYALTRWDQNLAVMDNERGKVLVFNPEGEHLRTIFTWNKKISLSFEIQAKGNRLYICDFAATNAQTPNHVILDTSESQFRVLWGFGKRLPILHQPKKEPIPKFFFTAFSLIGDRIWVGSPYSNHLELYQSDGRFIKKVPTGIDGKPPDAFKNVHDRHEMIEVMGSKPWTYQIFALDPLVLVFFNAMGSSKTNPRRMSIYDYNGFILANNLKITSPFHLSLISHTDNAVVGAKDLSHLNPDVFDRELRDHEFLRLLESGFHMNNRKEDNPYLFYYGLSDALDP